MFLTTPTTPATPQQQPHPERYLRVDQLCRIPAVTPQKAEENRAKRDAARKAGDRRKGAKNTRHSGRIVKPRPAREGIVPLSRATILAKVKAGTFPAPIKLGARCTVWRESDVLAWIESQGV